MSLKKIQDAIDSGSSIEKDLNDLDNAKTDKQILSIAHTIRAKRSVRNDIVCDIVKIINEEKANGTAI